MIASTRARRPSSLPRPVARRLRVVGFVFVVASAVAPLGAQSDAPAPPGATRPTSRAASRPEDRRAEIARLYRERRFDEALERLTPALVDRADAAEWWIMAAEISLAAEDYGAAATRFETALRLRPAASELTVNLALAYVRLDRLEEGRRHAARFADDARPERAAKARLALGLAAQALGETDAARAHFVRATELQPQDARALYRLGLLDLETGAYATAAERFRDALTRDRLHHGAAHGLARALRAAGRDAEAAAAEKRHAQLVDVVDGIRRTLRDLPRSREPAKTCFDLASLYALARDKTAALYWLDRALEADPGYAPALALKPHLAATKEERP